MYLILKNHHEEYAAREMIASHICKTKIEITDVIPENGDYVVSELTEVDGIYTYTCVLSLDSMEYTASVTVKEANKIYVKKTIN